MLPAGPIDVPLIIVYGAFGVGKSTLAPHLARLLPQCLVLDVDWLLGPLSDVAGHDLAQDPASWPAIRRAWLAIAAASAVAGRPTLLLTPSTPAEVLEHGNRALVSHLHALLLDCDAGALRTRLSQREGWQPEWTEEAIADAARYRTLGHDAITTSAGPPEVTAATVAAWVRARLA